MADNQSLLLCLVRIQKGLFNAFELNKYVYDFQAFGKPLVANRIGQWRYRIGDYRVITKIEDDELIIIVISIGHRREINNL